MNTIYDKIIYINLLKACVLSTDLNKYEKRGIEMADFEDFEYARKLCVSELNRILPMVRETIKKQQSLNKLLDEKEDKEKELRNLNEIIQHLMNLILLLSDDNDMISKCEALKKVKEEEKEKLKSSIYTIDEIVSGLEYRLDFEKKLYKSVFQLIASKKNHIFLDKNELKEEFLKEYIYLLVCDPILTKGNFFIGNCYTDFCEMVNKKYTPAQAKILETIENEEQNESLFFELFK